MKKTMNAWGVKPNDRVRGSMATEWHLKCGAPKIYKADRVCVVCGCLLSRYNGERKCAPCREKGEA